MQPPLAVGHQARVRGIPDSASRSVHPIKLDNMKYHKLHKMKDLGEYMILNKEDISLEYKTKYTLINLSKKIKWYEEKLEEKKQKQENEIQKIKDENNMQKPNN